MHVHFTAKEKNFKYWTLVNDMHSEVFRESILM